MEYFVDCVVGAHNSDVFHHPRFEIQILPRSAIILGVVDDPSPVFLIDRYFYVVRIRAAEQKE